MEIHPLLFISSHSYFEVDLNMELKEESTSIYERPPIEKIQNTLIARQLQFFSKPLKEPRQLMFMLASGEKILGSIESVDGCEVKLNCYDTKRMIHANDIIAIY